MGCNPTGRGGSRRLGGIVRSSIQQDRLLQATLLQAFTGSACASRWRIEFRPALPLVRLYAADQDDALISIHEEALRFFIHAIRLSQFNHSMVITHVQHTAARG